MFACLSGTEYKVLTISAYKNNILIKITLVYNNETCKSFYEAQVYK